MNVGSVKLELSFGKWEMLKRILNDISISKIKATHGLFSTSGHLISTYLVALARNRSCKFNIHKKIIQ